MSRPACWCREPTVELHRRQWDETVYLYDPRSGQTHVLNPMGALLFEALAERPMSEQELIDMAADLAGEPPENAVWAEAVKRLLATLDSLGLIRPCRD